jgi:hypothetical protein
MLIAMLGIGLVSGFFGLGAGWAAVPALKLIMGVPLKVTAACSGVLLGIEYRIKAAMERSNFTWDEAMEYIRDKDNNRNKWVKAIYHVARNDPKGYELVINLEHMSLATACEVVTAVANHEEFYTTPQSQKRMEDLVLAADIRAHIALELNILDHDAHVDGVIEIWGTLDIKIEAEGSGKWYETSRVFGAWKRIYGQNQYRNTRGDRRKQSSSTISPTPSGRQYSFAEEVEGTLPAPLLIG